MSRTVDNLVETGLAIRELDTGNRRYVSIRLTESGMGVFRNIEERMESYYKKVLGSIPRGKRNQVLESLELLIDAIKNNRCC